MIPPSYEVAMRMVQDANDLRELHAGLFAAMTAIEIELDWAGVVVLDLRGANLDYTDEEVDDILAEFGEDWEG